jgi:epoxyqueuosine reductase
MTIKTLPTTEIISTAESYDGIQAGIVSLKDVLKSPSYQSRPAGPVIRNSRLNDVQDDHWPAWAQTVLVLGLYHPEKDPRLDYWEYGDTWGNRRLREISEELRYWLRWSYHLFSSALPYHAGKGGIFLKDAAALSGIGIIGRNNLVIHPKWGPRIRLRAILLENEFQATGALEGFSPCETCKVFCQKACPMNAFPHGKYNRMVCNDQLHADLKNRVPCGEIGESGERNLVVSHCRACEMACPVGA